MPPDHAGPRRVAQPDRVGVARPARPAPGHRVDLPQLVRPNAPSPAGARGGGRFDSVEGRAYTQRSRGPIPGDGATHDRPGPVRTGFPEENQR